MCEPEHANRPEAWTGRILSNPLVIPSIRTVGLFLTCWWHKICTNQIREKKAEEGAGKSDGKQGEGEEGGSEEVQKGWVESMVQRIHPFHLFQRVGVIRLISFT